MKMEWLLAASHPTREALQGAVVVPEKRYAFGVGPVYLFSVLLRRLVHGGSLRADPTGLHVPIPWRRSLGRSSRLPAERKRGIALPCSVPDELYQMRYQTDTSGARTRVTAPLYRPQRA